MRKIGLLLSVLVLAASAFAEEAIDMALIHCEAMGGMTRIGELKSLKAKGYTRIADRTIEIIIIAQAPNRVRTEVLSEGHRIINAYDGENQPWQCDKTQGSEKVTLMENDAARAFIVDSEFMDPLISREARGFTLRSLGASDWEGGHYQCLLAMKTGEEPAELWLDASTYLISRQIRTRKLPNGGETKIETRFSEFRPVKGVLLPYRITVYAEGRRLHETVLQSVEPNPELGTETFKAP